MLSSRHCPLLQREQKSQLRLIFLLPYQKPFLLKLNLPLLHGSTLLLHLLHLHSIPHQVLHCLKLTLISQLLILLRSPSSGEMIFLKIIQMKKLVNQASPAVTSPSSPEGLFFSQLHQPPNILYLRTTPSPKGLFFFQLP